MRKKEPPSPTMAAAGHDSECPRYHATAVSRALEWKRRSIDQEIEDFRARKEQEFRAFEVGLSNGLIAPDQVELDQNGVAAAVVPAADGPGPPAAAAGAANGLMPMPSGSPATSRHDKEKELQGLFLPHFIPLLDTKSRQAPNVDAAALQNAAGMSAHPPIYATSDAAILSPRASPSPTLIALQAPSLRPAGVAVGPSLSDEIAPTQTRSLTPPLESPLEDLPLLTRSPARKIHPRRSFSEESFSPASVRPASLQRSLSTQSEGSGHGLRSSLRKPNGNSNGGHKKSVRISIDDVVMAPGRESPIQIRGLWNVPQSSSWDETNRSPIATRKRPSARTKHVENVDAEDARSEMLNKRDNGYSSGFTSIVRRDNQSVDSGRIPSQDLAKREENGEFPGFFPPQPLRSPLKPSSARIYGRDLIEPIRTPPSPAPDANPVDADDFFTSDPLFGNGAGNASSRRHSGEDDRRSPRGDIIEEDMFQDYEDGREDMDVVNGHDLLEEEEAEEERRRKTQGDYFSNYQSSDSRLAGTSPHAGSLPIEIRGPRGWGASTIR